MVTTKNISKLLLSIQLLIFLSLLTLLISCDNNDPEIDDELEKFYEADIGYSDGEYCAEVEYTNTKTGVISMYTLNVEVEFNSVTKIQFPNGGKLDTNHFELVEIDKYGYSSILTKDEEEYNIQLTGEPCDYAQTLIIDKKGNIIKEE